MHRWLTKWYFTLILNDNLFDYFKVLTQPYDEQCTHDDSSATSLLLKSLSELSVSSFSDGRLLMSMQIPFGTLF